MEEDIELLEEKIKRVHKINDLSGTYVPINILENLIKGYRELEENINGYQEEIIYQSKTIMELEDQIHYYASEIKEIADELEEDGFTEYANEINNTCILQDEFYGGKIK